MADGNEGKPEGQVEQQAAAVDAAAKAAADKAAQDAAAAQQGNPPADDKAKQEADAAKAEADAKAKADAEAAEKAKTQSEDLDTEKWGSTGDETGDSVLLILQNSGMEVDTAKALLYDAVAAGDVTKIDRDALVEKVGKAQANLILAGVENYVTKTTARVQEAVTALHTVAGSKENWDQVAAWAKGNIPDAELQEYRDLIDAGGAKAKYAAQQIVEKYNAVDSHDSVGKSEAEPGGKAQEKQEALTRAEYFERVDKLHKERKATPAALKSLLAARERGKAKGL